jgi:hypothetical protein
MFRRNFFWSVTSGTAPTGQGSAAWYMRRRRRG